VKILFLFGGMPLSSVFCCPGGGILFFLHHLFVFYKFFLYFYWTFPHPAFHNAPRQNVNFAVIFR
jgi:hypothetical protein